MPIHLFHKKVTIGILLLSEILPIIGKMKLFLYMSKKQHYMH